MKRFAVTIFSLLLSACVLTGCGRRMDSETSDTTTHTSSNSEPVIESTTITNSSEMPEVSTMPSTSSSNVEIDPNSSRSHTHHRSFPHTNIRKR